MKWVHRDEWFCWCYVSDNPSIRTQRNSKLVPDEIANRLEAAESALLNVQQEINDFVPPSD